MARVQKPRSRILLGDTDGAGRTQTPAERQVSSHTCALTLFSEMTQSVTSCRSSGMWLSVPRSTCSTKSAMEKMRFQWLLSREGASHSAVTTGTGGGGAGRWGRELPAEPRPPHGSSAPVSLSWPCAWCVPASL